jgi:hypothetical protein
MMSKVLRSIFYTWYVVESFSDWIVCYSFYFSDISGNFCKEHTLHPYRSQSIGMARKLIKEENELCVKNAGRSVQVKN